MSSERSLVLDISFCISFSTYSLNPHPNLTLHVPFSSFMPSITAFYFPKLEAFIWPIPNFLTSIINSDEINNI